MRLPRPSLVRRLTMGFVIGPAVAIFLLMIAVRPLMAQLEDSNVGPQVALSLLSNDLLRNDAGKLSLRTDAELLDLARRSPRLWFIAEDGTGELTFGPVPAKAREMQTLLSKGVKSALFGDLGADGRTGDATFAVVDTEAGRLRLWVGGVSPDALDTSIWLSFAYYDEEFSLGFFFIVIVCLSGAPIAIPIVLTGVRRTARAAADLDPSDPAKRLPEQGVVKELLPIVHAFNGALDRLGEAFERRRRFIADVAHELRTPLAVLNMHVEALPAGGKKPDLQRTVYRLGQMIGQMLDTERLTLARRRHERIDLVALTREAVANVAPLAAANGYEVAFNSSSDALLIDGDPHAISRAIANLLGNALAHGGGTGLIEIVVGKDATVDVIDQGEGVPVEARERIFEPFHRERWDRDGCGLGLHLVREIMRAHGGRAHLVGSGPGARFRLEFASALPVVSSAD